MTTKEQERKALAQIEKIIAGLGENSYVATAFEGCFEIARENIENDFACSMKQRMDAAESKAITAEQTAADLRRKLDAKTQDLIEYESFHRETVETIHAREFSLMRKIIPDDDLYSFISMLNAENETDEKALRETEKTIVMYAENPQQACFTNAVRLNRTIQERIDYRNSIKNRAQSALDA